MLEKISKGFAYFGGGIFLACAVLVTVDVIFRKIFIPVTLYSVEITGYGFAIAVALGYGYSIFSKAHIRINVVYQYFPQVARAAFDAVAMLSLSAVALILFYSAAILLVENFQLGGTSATTLRMPLFLPQGIWVLGLGWFALVSVVFLGKGLRALARRRFSEVDDLIGLPKA